MRPGLHLIYVGDLDALARLLVNHLFLLDFVYLFQVQLLLGTEITRCNLRINHYVLLKACVLLFKMGELLAELLEELLNYAGEVIHSDMPVAGTLRHVHLEQVLQVTVDTQVVLDVKQLLSVAVGRMPRLLQLLMVFLLQTLDDSLVNGALVALICRGGASHFGCAVLSNFRAR